MSLRRSCERDYPHVSHEWGIEYAEMGIAWFECDGRVTQRTTEQETGNV